MNPDTYATNRNAYLRITTYALTQGHLLKSIQPIIENSDLVNNALDIVTNIIRCQPPYDMTPSNIRQYQQQEPTVKPFIMSGLFGGGGGGGGGGGANGSSAEQKEKKNDIQLDRDFILDLITQDILSISFFVDKLSPTLSIQYMQELPFDGVLKSIIRLNENNDWKNQEDKVANLLVNMTQLAKIQPEVYLEKVLVSFYLFLYSWLLPPTMMKIMNYQLIYVQINLFRIYMLNLFKPFYQIYHLHTLRNPNPQHPFNNKVKEEEEKKYPHKSLPIYSSMVTIAYYFLYFFLCF